MDGIRIKVDNRAALAALQRLAQQAGDLGGALNQIGEALAETTKQRFAAGRAPDGTPWAPNSAVTIDGFVNVFSGSRKKDGSLSKRGAARAGGKRPLIGETRRLSTEIFHQVVGDAVEIGSSLPYAATQQFGARRGAFGADRHGRPLPWGDIPARPFLGVSEADAELVEDIVGRWLVG